MLSVNQVTASSIADRRYQDKLFSSFVKEYLTECRKDRQYKLTYLRAYNKLNAFCKDQSIELYTHSLSGVLKDDFINHLKDQHLMLSTINQLLSLITTLLNKAKVYGYSVDATWFDEVDCEEEDSNAIYLTRDEIIKIYYFESLTRRQKEIRDIFVLGCFTALRYSDYSRLTASNCINDRIRIKQQKTRSVVEIPQNKYVKEIIQRYGGTIPKAPCIQQFNRMLHTIMHKVGFDDLIQVERTVGHNVISKAVPKWQLISSHTARRSAATNMYLANIPIFEIMTITGHKSHKSFMRYIRISHEEVMMSLATHQYFR